MALQVTVDHANGYLSRIMLKGMSRPPGKCQAGANRFHTD